MSAKTKIVVFKMKELIYTAVFIGLGILLIILLIYMFFPNKSTSETSVTPTLEDINSPQVSYIPGVYSSSMVLNGQSIDISVTVDAHHINSINLINLNDTITTMFPLVEPALEELTTQICYNQSLEGVTYADDAKFTSEALLKTIRAALKKAQTAE